MLYTIGSTGTLIQNSPASPVEHSAMTVKPTEPSSILTMPEGGALYIDGTKFADFTTVKNDQFIPIPATGKLYAVTRDGYRIFAGEFRRGDLVKVIAADVTEGEYITPQTTQDPDSYITMDELNIKAGENPFPWWILAIVGAGAYIISQ